QAARRLHPPRLLGLRRARCRRRRHGQAAHRRAGARMTATSYRTHTCGQLRAKDVGAAARLAGRGPRKGDHGHLLFIDLRDNDGLTQCVFDSSRPGFAAAESVRLESVINVSGTVVARAADAINPKLATGEVEVAVDELTLLSTAETLPIQ